MSRQWIPVAPLHKGPTAVQNDRLASCLGARGFVYGGPMASPQDGPTRKKQKIRARRKLAQWREKQGEQKPEAAKK